MKDLQNQIKEEQQVNTRATARAEKLLAVVLGQPKINRSQIDSDSLEYALFESIFNYSFHTLKNLFYRDEKGLDTNYFQEVSTIKNLLFHFGKYFDSPMQEKDITAEMLCVWLDETK